MRRSEDASSIKVAVCVERERWIAALTRWGNAGGPRRLCEAQALIMEVAGPDAAGIEIVQREQT